MRWDQCRDETNAGPVRDRFGTDSGPTWDRLGPIWDPIWDRSGTDLGPIWDRSGTDLGPIWDRSGTDLGPIWDRSGTDLGPIWDPIWDRSGSNRGRCCGWQMGRACAVGAGVVTRAPRGVLVLSGRHDACRSGPTPPWVPLVTTPAPSAQARPIFQPQQRPGWWVVGGWVGGGWVVGGVGWGGVGWGGWWWCWWCWCCWCCWCWCRLLVVVVVLGGGCWVVGGWWVLGGGCWVGGGSWCDGKLTAGTTHSCKMTGRQQVEPGQRAPVLQAAMVMKSKSRQDDHVVGTAHRTEGD